MRELAQNREILEFLKTGQHITQVTAFFKFDCWRLSARIHDLRREGHNIRTRIHHDEHSGKRYAVYSLIKAVE